MSTSLKMRSGDDGEMPPMYILPTHMPVEDIHEAEEALYHIGGHLANRASEARIFLTLVTQKKRAALELRSRGVWTEDVDLKIPDEADRSKVATEPVRKKRKIVQGVENDGKEYPFPFLTDRVMVLTLDWLSASVDQNEFRPFDPYLVYYARLIPKPQEQYSSPLSQITYIKATADGPSTPSKSQTQRPNLTSPTTANGQDNHNTNSRYALAARRRFGHSSNRTGDAEFKPSPYTPKLHRTTTSEFENRSSKTLPDPPEWVKTGNIYSCCRNTPMETANASFIAQLTKIKNARLLTLDEIGVRAYSTSIASISAYPHEIQSTSEILRLPGCNERIATLWAEWYDSSDENSTRWIQYVRDLDGDKDLQRLHLFWSCWGVGPDTARKWYFDHGWQDLDDVVEFGWNMLSRVQQIGVKYREEFDVPIPRDEVEQIAEVIHRHARKCRNIASDQFNTKHDIVCVIVGGHRRGKTNSGDVDVILSHREETYTKDLVVDVVRSLEEENWITHTLSLHTTTSDRGQATLPFRAERKEHRFDSLDKALCVWQDPEIYASTVSSPKPNVDPENIPTKPDPAEKKNTNIHRRVDIIISPWRTIGCAVLGWSGGTTFQRDIRRFVHKEKGWKFDSSGVRDRGTGRVVDLESPKKTKHRHGKVGNVKNEDGSTVKIEDGSKSAELDDGDERGEEKGHQKEEDTYLAREKRLMQNMGIGYREPWLRCTG